MSLARRARVVLVSLSLRVRPSPSASAERQVQKTQAPKPRSRPQGHEPIRATSPLGPAPDAWPRQHLVRAVPCRAVLAHRFSFCPHTFQRSEETPASLHHLLSAQLRPRTAILTCISCDGRPDLVGVLALWSCHAVKGRMEHD